MLAASMVKVIGSEKESEQEHKQNTFCENNTYDISSIKRVTRKCKREPVTCNVCRLSVHKSVTCLYKVGSFFIFNKVYQSLKWLSHFFTFTNFQMLHFISNCYDSLLCLLRSLFLFITNRVVSSQVLPNQSLKTQKQQQQQRRKQNSGIKAREKTT